MRIIFKHAICAGALSVLIATYASSQVHATLPGQNGAISFSSSRESLLDTEIYTMNPDGSDARRISNAAGNDMSPVWSPDGSKIVFYTNNRNGNFNEIFIMNPDGSGQTGIVTGGNSANPSWSPDGSKIVYQSSVSGNIDIYTMNANGSGSLRLTTAVGFDGVPVWSPDGSKIVFQSQRDGNNEIYIMNSDGTGQTRLTTVPAAFDVAPDFSPDGSKILFASNRSGNFQFYTMDLTGGNVQQIGAAPVLNNTTLPLARWSPDGTKIVFSLGIGSAGGNPIQRIYTMNSDGTNVTPLTLADQYTDAYPSWQPLSHPYIPTTPPSKPQIFSFTSLGAHPSASLQPSTLGKRISNILAYNGKLYPAYGDGTDNHGPVNVDLYNLSTRNYTGSLLSVSSEALSPFRVVNGLIYSTTYDPVGSGPAGYAVSSDSGNTWSLNLPITARHLLDIQAYNGNLFAAGAQGSAGIILRSTDNGATWLPSLSQTSPYSTNVRFYWMYQMNGLLYAQASVPSSPVQVFNGTSWTTATTAPVSYYWQRPVLFNNMLVSQLNGMSTYDGTTVNTVGTFTGWIRSMYVDGDYLYVLRGNDNSIVRTSDLSSWQELGSAPVGAYSIAIYNDRIYIGAENALIYESGLISATLATVNAVQNTLAPTGDSVHAILLIAGGLITASALVATIAARRLRKKWLVRQ